MPITMGFSHPLSLPCSGAQSPARRIVGVLAGTVCQSSPKLRGDGLGFVLPPDEPAVRDGLAVAVSEVEGGVPQRTRLAERRVGICTCASQVTQKNPRIALRTSPSGGPTC